MAPKSSRKRPAAALAELEEEAPASPQNNFDNATAGTTSDTSFPEAEIVYQLQGHGLVMRDGCLAPICIRGATTLVDNSCAKSSAIVSAGDDGSVRVWDAETGELRRVLKCANDSRDARLLSLTRFPSGQRILTTNQDGTACVFEVGSGKQIAKFGDHGSPAVLNGAIYGDDERLVTINAIGEFRFWSLAPSRVDAPLAGGTNTATAIAMFPGDRNIAVGTTSGKVEIWCCQSGKCTKEIHAASSPIIVLVVFPDGSKVLTASDNENFVGVWGIEDIQLVGFTSKVLSAAPSQCSSLAVTGEAKGLVKVWDVRSGDMLCCWSASSYPRNAVYTCEFLGESRLLAAGEWGCTVWELPEAACAALAKPCSDTATNSVASQIQRSSGLRVSFSLSPTSV